MVYMTVIEHSCDVLHLSRRPNFWSWCPLIGVIIGDLGVLYYGTGNILWEIICLLAALLWGLTGIEDWEECVFDKISGQVTIQKRNLLQILLPSVMKQPVVVANIEDIISVRVVENELKYFGQGQQVVLQLNTGVTLGVTESFTMGKTSDHHAIAHKIESFLQPYISPISPDNDVDDYLGGSSSSEDSFEQIGPQDLFPDPLPSVKPSIPDTHSDI